MILNVKSNKQQKRIKKGERKGELKTVRIKKSDSDYKKELKTLKNFSFGFENISLKQKIKPAQKRRITLAIDKIVSGGAEVKNMGYVPIRKKPKETIKAYQKRVKKLASNYGQNNNLRGIFVENYDPKKQKYSFNKKGELKLTNKNTGEQNTFLPFISKIYLEQGQKYFEDQFKQLKKNPLAETVFGIAFDKRQSVLRVPVSDFKIDIRAASLEYDNRIQAYFPKKDKLSDFEIFGAACEWFINMYLIDEDKIGFFNAFVSEEK